MMTIYELTEQFKELMNLIEDGEYTEGQLADTIEGLEGEIEIKADGYAKVMKSIEGNIACLKAEIERLTKKRTSLEQSIARLKTSLEMAMRETGKTKFKTELFSFGIQKNPAKLIITGDVPEEYLVPQPPKVDNAKIKDLLKTKELDFAKLEQGESLRIR